MGSRTDSQSDSTKIEGKLNELGTRIESIVSATQAPTASELSSIQDEYNAIAETFYKDFPLEIEQQKNRNTSQTIDQLKQSRRIEPYIHTLELMAKQLSEAFNKHRTATRISVEVPAFPTNIFAGDQYRMNWSFPNSRHWIIDLDPNKNGELQLRFRKATTEPAPNGRKYWNYDGFIILGFSKDVSSFHLVAHPNELEVRILADIPSSTEKKYTMGEFDGIAKTLLERDKKRGRES